MIKICHVTTVHKSNDIRIFQKECTSLVNAGYYVSLVAPGESREENGVHVSGMGNVSLSRIKRMTKLVNIAYRYAKKIDADIYHLHDPELLRVAVKLKKQGKRVVFDSHELYVEQFRTKEYLPKFVTSFISWAFERYQKSVFRKIDAVIFPCLVKGVHPFKGMCKEYITVDNTPILSELYDKYDSSTKKEENSICYIGSLTFARGITHMIKAAYKAKVKFYLAGNISDDYLHEITAMPEAECMEYLGVLNREEIKVLIEKCQIGMATILNTGQYNKTDNLPTKAYEYMALSVPVLLTKAPYNEEIVSKYNFGVCVDPCDIDSTAKVIRELLSNPQMIKEYGENGRALIKNKFNWEIEAEKLVQLYERL